MGVFKNGVGRPSNETIKKRRIVYVLSALAVVAAIASTAYMLNSSFNTKKIKGDGDGFSYSEHMTKAVNGIYYEVLESENVKIPYSGRALVRPSDEGVNIRISNSNSYDIYYRIYNPFNDKKLIEGKLKAKSKTVITVINIKNIKHSFIFALSAKKTNDFETTNDYKNWLVWEDPFAIDVTKSFVMYDKEYVNSTSISLAARKVGYLNDYRDNYLDNNNSVNYFTLNNYSSNNYYYRTFLYKDTKVNGAKVAGKGKCKLLKANSELKDNDRKTMLINEKNKKGTYQIKLYKNKSACNADTLGILKRNVVETLYKESMTYIEENQIYIGTEEYYDSRYDDIDKIVISVGIFESHKRFQLIVYGKQKGSNKYNEILNKKAYFPYVSNEKDFRWGNAYRTFSFNKKNIKSYKVYIRLLDKNGNSDESISINNWKPEGYKIVNKDGNKWATRTYNVK